VGPKGYPSCRYTHASVDAALALAQRHDLQPNQVEEIRVTVGPRDHHAVFGGNAAGGLRAKQHPPSVVDAQFSIPYTVATAIMRRRVFLDDFTEEAIRNRSIRDMAALVVPLIDPEFDRWPADVKPAQVEVRLKDGRAFSQRVDYPKGNPRNPVPFAEIRSNFLELATWATRPLARERVEQARDLIEGLDQVPDVSELPRLLSAS